MFTSVCIDGENFRFVIRSDPSDTDNNVNGPVLPPSRQLKIDSSKQLSFVKNWFLDESQHKQLQTTKERYNVARLYWFFNQQAQNYRWDIPWQSAITKWIDMPKDKWKSYMTLLLAFIACPELCSRSRGNWFSCYPRRSEAIPIARWETWKEWWRAHTSLHDWDRRNDSTWREAK